MDRVLRFTSQYKDKVPNKDEPCVFITTYTILTQGRAEAAMRILDGIWKIDWGLMIMDEVQVAPAETFKTVVNKVKAHTKLGLTATLVWEDDKVKDLNYLLGPKLYEANWKELEECGFLAKV